MNLAGNLKTMDRYIIDIEYTAVRAMKYSWRMFDSIDSNNWENIESVLMSYEWIRFCL